MSVLRAPKGRGGQGRFSSPSRRKPGKALPLSSRAIAFYDLDGTVVDLNLVHATLFVLANLGEWGGRIKYLLNFAARLPLLYLAEQKDRRLLNVVLFEAFKGISRDRLATLGEEYCERVLLKHVYPQARELIEANRRGGLEAVLVTGSPDFIISPFARHLAIHQFAANRLIYRGGLATGRLQTPIMAGEEKAEWCEAYAQAHRLNLTACWGYADSYYDLPFLAALGHPVAVNPDRQLAAAARSRHWPILRFGNAKAEQTGLEPLISHTRAEGT